MNCAAVGRITPMPTVQARSVVRQHDPARETTQLAATGANPRVPSLHLNSSSAPNASGTQSNQRGERCTPWHAPEVECIGKGSQKPYSLVCSIVTHKSGLMVGHGRSPAILRRHILGAP